MANYRDLNCRTTYLGQFTVAFNTYLKCDCSPMCARCHDFSNLCGELTKHMKEHIEDYAEELEKKAFTFSSET